MKRIRNTNPFSPANIWNIVYSGNLEKISSIDYPQECLNIMLRDAVSLNKKKIIKYLINEKNVSIYEGEIPNKIMELFRFGKKYNKKLKELSEERFKIWIKML